MMSKGWIGRLLSPEAEELPSDVSRKTADQLRVPTLDERANLYLRAVRGKRDFGGKEYADARNCILDAMAAHIVELQDISGMPPRQPGAHDPYETARARLVALASRPSEALARRVNPAPVFEASVNAREELARSVTSLASARLGRAGPAPAA